MINLKKWAALPLWKKYNLHIHVKSHVVVQSYVDINLHIILLSVFSIWEDKKSHVETNSNIMGTCNQAFLTTCDITMCDLKNKCYTYLYLYIAKTFLLITTR